MVAGVLLTRPGVIIVCSSQGSGGLNIEDTPTAFLDRSQLPVDRSAKMAVAAPPGSAGLVAFFPSRPAKNLGRLDAPSAPGLA